MHPAVHRVADLVGTFGLVGAGVPVAEGAELTG